MKYSGTAVHIVMQGEEGEWILTKYLSDISESKR